MLRGATAEAILSWLTECLGPDYHGADIRGSGAGCINDTYEVSKAGLDSVFIKVGAPGQWEMYQVEARGLRLLARCDAVRVPAVLGCTQLMDCAVLALEFIPLRSLRAGHERRFGAALAELHDITADQFGLDHNNYIGRTHQINEPDLDWWHFYRQCRLLPQRKLAQARGMRQGLLQDLDQLLERLPGRLAEHQPRPALVHGDLWSGNMAVDSDGRPTLFDPAVYYGDGETDLAMSRMFGGPGQAFYDAYHRIRPPLPDAELRRPLYDLYHWLNHFNMFGVGYLGQVELTLQVLLRELT